MALHLDPFEHDPLGRSEDTVRVGDIRPDWRVSADGIEVFSEDTAWDALAEVPEDSAAALILLEHRWAIPLREAVARAGGYRLASEFVSALDLVEFGLVEAEEAEALATAKADAL